MRGGSLSPEVLDDLRERVATPADRVPPGQVPNTNWPVLHYGDVPQVDTRTWTFQVGGLVERPYTLTYDELLALPRKTVTCDMHCVTRWSRSWTEERYGGRALTQHEINRMRNRSKTQG